MNKSHFIIEVEFITQIVFKRLFQIISIKTCKLNGLTCWNVCFLPLPSQKSIGVGGEKGKKK